jgi:hypothetical protein
MNARSEDPSSPNESLASLPPEPVLDEEVPLALDLGAGFVCVTVAAASAVVLVGASLLPAVGATRTARLEWARRRALIAEAERESCHLSDDQAADQGTGEQGAPRGE